MLEEKVAPRHYIRQSFELFEQLSEAAVGWEMDFRQLSATQSPFFLEQFATSQMLYSRASFGSHFHQKGGPAPGFRTFALGAQGCSDFRWCGEAVNRQSLIVLPADGEFESVSSPGFDIYTFSLSYDLLEQTARHQFQRPLAEFLGSCGQVCHQARAQLRELRSLLDLLSRDINHFSGLAQSPQGSGRSAIERMEQQLAWLVLACLDRGETRQPCGARSKRMLTLAHALEVIDSPVLRELTVPELVSRVGVSRRTLEYAFQDRLGVSPSNYLKARRLKLLHQDLLAADRTCSSVQSLSLQHGFRHLGQMAGDYHQLFGELPNATLRRA